jgi:hypothetical protein
MFPELGSGPSFCFDAGIGSSWKAEAGFIFCVLPVPMRGVVSANDGGVLARFQSYFTVFISLSRGISSKAITASLPLP